MCVRRRVYATTVRERTAYAREAGSDGTMPILTDAFLIFFELLLRLLFDGLRAALGLMSGGMSSG